MRTLEAWLIAPEDGNPLSGPVEGLQQLDADIRPGRGSRGDVPTAAIRTTREQPFNGTTWACFVEFPDRREQRVTARY
jgi:hypothetical protein